jgi:peptidyl-prolyl cis-trans isomerase D
MRPLNVPSASVRAIFASDAAKLPVFVGVESAEGYRLYRINRVAAVEPPAEQVKAMRNDMRRLLAQEEMRAYLESIKAATKIKIEPSALEPKAE